MDPETYVPDKPQVAKYFMQDKEYYIGYASALKIHGFTRKVETREYMVTKKQMKPAIRIFRGIEYRFIHHSATRFFGFRSIWINQYEKAMVSDLERTIVDIATQPQFCGGIIGVGNAIFKAKFRTDRDKLFYYFARNRNKSAKKRFLFLTELLNLEWTNKHERMMKELGSGISLLDPTETHQGRKNKKYGLKINVDPTKIKKVVLHRNMF
jgi:predicted transcriptional regulator of viral defense system